MGRASAPGKVIITGEHSVVYGKPALAAALDLRCTVEVKDADLGLKIQALDLNKVIYYNAEELVKILNAKPIDNLVINLGFDNLARAVTTCINPKDVALDISITSSVPIGAGLGSSAATAVAIIGAIFDHFNWDWNISNISQKAFEAEIVAHGTPSGIDNSVSSLGGLIHFESGDINQRELKDDIPLVIANTGIDRNTKSLVDAVRTKYNRYPETIDKILDLMADVSLNIEKHLLNNELMEAGELFNINQGLLDSIGVNHPRLSTLIQIARDHGALGAKLTGAGGGGCMIALVEEHKVSKVVSALRAENVQVYQTSISRKGVVKE